MEYSGAGGKLIHEKNQKQKISWHCPFKLKGSHSMGDWRIFLKSRRDVSFKKGLSNEPTFGLIHLAGQYLSEVFYE